MCVVAYGPRDDDGRGGYKNNNRHESGHGNQGSIGHQTGQFGHDSSRHGSHGGHDDDRHSGYGQGGHGQSGYGQGGRGGNDDHRHNDGHGRKY